MSSPIPPPMQWPPDDGLEIMLPFELADAPRQFLNFLATNSYLKKNQREAIGEWMLAYNEALAEWIQATYGPDAVDVANGLAMKGYQEFVDDVRSHSEALTNDVFKRLEGEMGDETSQDS